MTWNDSERVEFVRTLHDYWPTKVSPRADDEYSEALERFTLQVALQALKRVKHEEEFNKRPTIKALKAVANELAYAYGGHSSSPKAALIARLCDEHLRKTWSGGKARVKILATGLHLADKKPGDWTLPWGDCLESDLRRVVTDLERGQEEAPF